MVLDGKKWAIRTITKEVMHVWNRTERCDAHAAGSARYGRFGSVPFADPVFALDAHIQLLPSICLGPEEELCDGRSLPLHCHRHATTSQHSMTGAVEHDLEWGSIPTRLRRNTTQSRKRPMGDICCLQIVAAAWELPIAGRKQKAESRK